MSGDRVYWHEGDRTARVPASCIDAIVETAHRAEKVQPATVVAVFAALALHADGSGGGARPKAETIADLLGMSAPQVRRCIAVCIDAGVVTKEPLVVNGRKVGNVYTLTRPHDQTPNAPGGAPTNAPGGARHSRLGARLEEQPLEQTKEEQTSISRDPEALFDLGGAETVMRSDPLAGFDEFWAVYPRRVAKGAARKAWPKAVTAAGGVEPILAGARRYAAERDGEDPKFTAHPATWLNRESWADEPTRPTRRPSSHRGVDQDRDRPEEVLRL